MPPGNIAGAADFSADVPPQVWLNEFARDHLELKLIYWYHPPSYWDYTRHADEVNRDILRAFEKAGIHIALPAFTTRISDESGSPVTPPQEASDPSR